MDRRCIHCQVCGLYSCSVRFFFFNFVYFCLVSRGGGGGVLGLVDLTSGGVIRAVLSWTSGLDSGSTPVVCCWQGVRGEWGGIFHGYYMKKKKRCR